MKKWVFLLILILMPLVTAINIDVKEISSNPTIIRDFGTPAVVTLEITNNEAKDRTYSFTSLSGAKIEPIGSTEVPSKSTREVTIKIYPREDLDYYGNLIFDYLIFDENYGKSEQQVIIRIIKLESAFEIIPDSINPGKNTLDISVRNKENYNFENVKFRLSSAFFNLNQEIDFGPFEKKTFTVNLKQDEVSKLLAGVYKINGDFEISDKEFKIEKEIRFEENDRIIESESSKGFIIKTKTISKSNEGNLMKEVETTLNKNIISRLFTSFSPEPDSVKRNGLFVDYTWKENLNPGTSLNVVVRTNWFLPLIFLLVVFVVGYIAKGYVNNGIIMRKKISFVRANGGEFALKVSVIVKATKNVDRVVIIDRLPGLVKLHERFGVEQPSKIDEKRKRIEWNFPTLEAGDSRVISYIIYSKIGVLGRFALPSTTAIFERDGKVHEAHSNRAFFVAEQKSSTD